MERQVCRHGALRREGGGGGGGRERRGSGGCLRDLFPQLLLPPEMACWVLQRLRSKSVLLVCSNICVHNYFHLSGVPCASNSRTPSFYWGDYQTFLSLMESRCETGNEDEMLCLTLRTSANAEFYDSVTSGKQSFTL